jgi:hypothetical protein
MKILLLIFLGLALVVACSPGTRVVEDPLFPEDRIIFHEDGRRDRLVEDALYPEDYLYFRGRDYVEEEEYS